MDLPNNFFAHTCSHAARHHSTSNSMAYLPSCCDEELVEEADEPPDNFAHLFSQSYHPDSPFPEREFEKHTIRNSAPTVSLLTRALTMPTNTESTATTNTRPQRGMSTSSTWSSASAASTVDLVSDGITSPSRANTPSPPAPNFFTGIQGILQRTKIAFQEPQMKTEFVKQEVEPLEQQQQQRKPCITFACVGRQAPATAAAVEQPKMQAPETRQAENVAPKKKGGLTFACDLKPKEQLCQRPASPEKIKSAPVTILGTEEKYAREPRRLYDSEDVEDSWTNQPIDHSRLLKVDDVLKKERDIRKLSEEAEREEKQENGEDDDEEEDDNDGEDGVDVDEEEDQDDNDDDEDNDDEDDEDDEDDYGEDDEDGDVMSGNETDTEEGFASDDDSDDDLFFGPHPPFLSKPVCCRTASDTSVDSFPKATPRRHERSPTPELPDSTDFVCGTLDEDRALEEAFVTCIAERKSKAKGKPTPQDIDPSFPVSDPDSDDEPLPARKTKAPLSRSQSSVEHRGRYHSPSPPRRPSRRGTICHSPAPNRIRSRVTSPAPTRRLHSPPPPTRSNKSSRHPSPAPRGRAMSPAPQFKSRNIARTRSLPRTSACVRRTAKSARGLAGNNSPTKRATRPMQIKRGAADIFKGLEKRRERRKARMGRKREAEEEWRAGEGVEKMRELALELGGKERRVQWVISA